MRTGTIFQRSHKSAQVLIKSFQSKRGRASERRDVKDSSLSAATSDARVSADSVIREPELFHGARLEEISPVEDNGCMHNLADPLEINRLKFSPFSRQDQRFSIFSRFK